jgi:hypothetical protein
MQGILNDRIEVTISEMAVASSLKDTIDDGILEGHKYYSKSKASSFQLQTSPYQSILFAYYLQYDRTFSLFSIHF